MSLAMRNEVPVELTWDLSLIYPTEEASGDDSPDDTDWQLY